MMEFINSVELLKFVFYTICVLIVLAILSVFILFSLKNKIDSYEKKINIKKNEFIDFFKKYGFKDSSLELNTDVDVVALCEYCIDNFKENKKDILKIIVDFNLADKIFELYKKSYTSFYKDYYISILVELRSSKYRRFFNEQLLLKNISNEEAGYFLYGIAILKNDYNELVSLYKSIQNVYENHHITQLFSELVLSEAFENSQYEDIKQFFFNFLIKEEDTGSVFLSAIYAIDERKDDNWDEVLALFYQKYKDNRDVKEAVVQIYAELHNDKEDSIKKLEAL